RRLQYAWVDVLYQSGSGTHYSVFFFTEPATAALDPLSLHDALPISAGGDRHRGAGSRRALGRMEAQAGPDDHRQGDPRGGRSARSEEHTSELKSPYDLVCRLLLEKKKRLRFRSSSTPDIAEKIPRTS